MTEPSYKLIIVTGLPHAPLEEGRYSHRGDEDFFSLYFLFSGLLLFYFHLCTISQAALTGNHNSCTVGYTADELVCIAKALAQLYLHVAYLTIIIYVHEALARAGLLHDSHVGHHHAMLGAEVEDLKFIVSLAGTAVSGDKILIEQNRLLLEKSGVASDVVTSYCELLKDIYDLKRSNVQFDREDKIKELKAKYSNLSLQMTGNIAALLQPQAWIDYFISYDPTDALKKITCKVLALNGDKDVQVIANQNISALKQHIPAEQLTTKIYPDLNHLFQHCNTGMPNEYYQIEETIAPEVLKDITSWIKECK